MFSATLIGLALHANHPTPSVAELELSSLARYADGIVVARVERVLCFGDEGSRDTPVRPDGTPGPCTDGVRLAELVVQRVVFGDPAWSRLWLFAEPTWICDTTTAVLGERALFFLKLSEPPAGMEEVFVEAAREVTGGRPLFQDAWSGRGRMPVRDQGGVPSITSWHDVRPPKKLATTPAEHEGEYASLFWMAPLDEVLGFVEGVATGWSTPLPLHPTAGVPAAAAVVAGEDRVLAAFWRDGTAIVRAGPFHGFAPLEIGELDAHELRTLENEHLERKGGWRGSSRGEPLPDPPHVPNAEYRAAIRMPWFARDVGSLDPPRPGTDRDPFQELARDLLELAPVTGRAYDGPARFR